MDYKKKLDYFLSNTTDKLRGYIGSGEVGRVVIELVFAKIIFDANSVKESYLNKVLDIDVDIKNRNIIEDSISDFINKVNKLENSNKELLEGIFICKELLVDKRLKAVFNEVIDDLRDINFKDSLYDSKTIGSIFNDFIYSTLTSTEPEHLSPMSIKKLVSKIFEAESIKTIYDPNIGIGGIILEVALQHKDSEIFGQDINKNILDICKMLFIVNQKDESIKNLYSGDTLVNPKIIENNKLKKFDCVVSQPPFGIKEWGYKELIDDKFNRFHRGFPSKLSADYAFISHIVESLDEEGVAAILMPNGVLFRGGVEGKIREQLVKENLIDCIISLPSNMLYNTSIATSLIIFRKNRNRKDVLFIDAVKKDEKISKVNTILLDEDIDKISTAYKQYDTIDGFSKVIMMEKIEENSFNLSVSRYVETFEREELDLDVINDKVKHLEQNLSRIQKEINNYLD